MSKTYLELHDLTVGYGGVPVVSGISLTLQRGGITTLIGPNGSGKSTVLKTVTRRLPAISGKVLLEGADIRSLRGRELAKKMAVVLTDRVRPELMTCFDVAAAGRYPYTGSFGLLSKRDREIVARALNEVNAGDIAEADFASVSDGQRQRVLLARAIAQEPELIILDEPTSYLDIRHKLELLEILRSMAKKRGVTVVMSLHEIDLASKVSDAVACISEGRVSAWGTPEEIFSDEAVSTLYGLERGHYNAALGFLELARPSGEPRVFVLGGGGCGISLYRELQKAGIPFAAGILADNDVDLPVAAALASRVVVSGAFEPLSEVRLSEAKALLDSSDFVLNAGFQSPWNLALLEYAREHGKRVLTGLGEVL